VCGSARPRWAGGRGSPRLRDICSFWPVVSESGTSAFVKAQRQGQVPSADLPRGAGRFSPSPRRLSHAQFHRATPKTQRGGVSRAVCRTGGQVGQRAAQPQLLAWRRPRRWPHLTPEGITAPSLSGTPGAGWSVRMPPSMRTSPIQHGRERVGHGKKPSLAESHRALELAQCRRARTKFTSLLARGQDCRPPMTC
jgi:hypothetical protein